MGLGGGIHTPSISVVLYVVAAFVGALGQMLYKTGADHADGTLLGYVANIRILAGVACYIAVMVLFVAGFRKGGSLTVLYPVYASTFIWGALIAWHVFGTPIKPVNVVGMVVLVLGMYLMGR